MPEYSKNQLLRHDDRIIRVLTVDTDVLTIDCLKRTMPQWMPAEDLQDWEPCDESALPSPEAPICNIAQKIQHLPVPTHPFISLMPSIGGSKIQNTDYSDQHRLKSVGAPMEL